MGSKKPYWPFFSDDWLGSLRILELPRGSRGLFVEFLAASWSTPISEARLETLAASRLWGTGWEDDWKELVDRGLVVLVDGDWISPKLELLRDGPTPDARRKARKKREADRKIPGKVPEKAADFSGNPIGSGSSSGEREKRGCGGEEREVRFPDEIEHLASLEVPRPSDEELVVCEGHLEKLTRARVPGSGLEELPRGKEALEPALRAWVFRRALNRGRSGRPYAAPTIAWFRAEWSKLRRLGPEAARSMLEDARTGGWSKLPEEAVKKREAPGL